MSGVLRENPGAANKKRMHLASFFYGQGMIKPHSHPAAAQQGQPQQ